MCVVSSTLAGGSSPPPAPQLMYSARPVSQGPLGRRWEATGARFGAQIAPKHAHFHRWKSRIAVKIGFLARDREGGVGYQRRCCWCRLVAHWQRGLQVPGRLRLPNQRMGRGRRWRRLLRWWRRCGGSNYHHGGGGGGSGYAGPIAGLGYGSVAHTTGGGSSQYSHGMVSMSFLQPAPSGGGSC